MSKIREKKNINMKIMKSFNAIDKKNMLKFFLRNTHTFTEFWQKYEELDKQTSEAIQKKKEEYAEIQKKFFQEAYEESTENKQSGQLEKTSNTSVEKKQEELITTTPTVQTYTPTPCPTQVSIKDLPQLTAQNIPDNDGNLTNEPLPQNTPLPLPISPTEQVILENLQHTEEEINRIHTISNNGFTRIRNILEAVGVNITTSERLTESYNLAIDRLRNAISTTNLSTWARYRAMGGFFGYMAYQVIVNRQIPNIFSAGTGLIGAIAGRSQTPANTTNITINTTGEQPQMMPLGNNENIRYSVDRNILSTPSASNNNPFPPRSEGFVEQLVNAFKDNPTEACMVSLVAILAFLRKK